MSMLLWLQFVTQGLFSSASNNPHDSPPKTILRFIPILHKRQTTCYTAVESPKHLKQLKSLISYPIITFVVNRPLSDN
ncbi:hypothetical protein F4810DRAFT_10443 [Camillea tinctor]|nr:hypothetical protein F4810DRAFT_10443 [Camillea tinctor]